MPTGCSPPSSRRDCCGGGDRDHTVRELGGWVRATVKRAAQPARRGTTRPAGRAGAGGRRRGVPNAGNGDHHAPRAGRAGGRGAPVPGRAGGNRGLPGGPGRGGRDPGRDRRRRPRSGGSVDRDRRQRRGEADPGSRTSDRRLASARCTSSAMYPASSAHSSRGRWWPMPSKITSFAPGMAAAVARPPLMSLILSSVPCLTSVGTRSSRKRSVRSPEATTATAWRSMPTGSWPRS